MDVTLEQIVTNISSMFTKPAQSSVKLKSTNTSNDALAEVERLEELSQKYQSTYHEEKDKIRSVTFNQLCTTSLDVTQLNTAISNLQVLESLIPQANKHYIELLMQENGIQSPEDITTKITTLAMQKNALSKQWFGPWRFSTDIKRINKEIEHQWELWSNIDRFPKIPRNFGETVNDISAQQINYYVINRIVDSWQDKILDVPAYETNTNLSETQNTVLRDVHNILARKEQENLLQSANNCIERIASLDKNLDRVRRYQKFKTNIEEVDMTKFDFDTFQTLPQQYKGASHDIVKKRLTEQFLTTPEHTDDSNKLGRQFTQYKDQKSVLYNTLNFWRESGISGQRPLIEGDSDKDSTAQAYLKSLDFSRQNKDVQVIMQELQSSNNHHAAPIKSALKNIALDMLKNGSKSEQYFALNTIAQFKDIDEPLIEATKSLLGIDREINDTDLLSRVLKKMTSNNNDLSSYAEALQDMIDYNEQIQKIKDTSDKPDLLENITRSLFDEYRIINNPKKQSKNIAVLKALNNIDHLFTDDIIQELGQKLRRVYYKGDSVFSENVEKAIQNFHEIIRMSDEFSHPELQNVITSCTLNEDVDHPEQVRAYMSIISKPKISTKFEVLSAPRQNIIRNTAENAYQINKKFSDHFTENMILREKSMAKLWLLNRSLSDLKNYALLENHIVHNQSPNESYKTVTMFGLIRPTIDDKFEEDLQDIFESESDAIAEYTRLIQKQGVTPKPKSIKKLQKMVDQASRFKTKDDVVSQQRYQERIRTINNTLSRERTTLVNNALNNTVYRNIEKIVGKPVKVEITEDVINATLLYNDISKNKKLLQDLLKSVVDNTYDPYKDEKNIAYMDSMREKGMDTNIWTSGISKTYTPKLVENIEQKIKSEIEHHTNEAHAILSHHKIEADTLEDGYNVLKASNVNHDDVRDLKTQIQAIKALENRNTCQNYSNITIHLEQDPLKILQMGNYSSNSCLGLGKGNAWSTVANAVDCNKQVLYATMNGQVVGRKLIAINTDHKMVQYRTYTDNIDLDLDTMFEDYLTAFAEKVNIEQGTSGTVNKIVADHWYNDGIIS